ncbi:hypothetical protein ASPACDRAFT_42093 [Aspergillus aculeatus ATCC 16872]|uniref:Uncharacterized protein n=1 Tax=Aspergillus aculeatus (strain ATCC 16872 / CBS 172.66 / WB 5094) TaxID=690307 RepID=A0A1L9X136_ASPA1|nr:uncharacterized protein ASPACDRAFT_42093 [Aspergillus aculeatus ATCC 16872]OJK01828.1 hypothetical protein ASPACDRAFT_42093 [Aspergillus aculeatus ATCC 16872]
MASDAAGPLDLSREVEKPGPPIVLQKWKASPPQNAPLFDFRLIFSGAISSGYGFLACPPSQSPDQEVEVQVEWDLTHAPPMTRAIWIFGEGPNPVCRTMTYAEIQATYFMVGRVSSHGDERFGMYWMGDPTFDAHLMAEFFNDQEDPYRIFIRYNPY